MISSGLSSILQRKLSVLCYSARPTCCLSPAFNISSRRVRLGAPVVLCSSRTAGGSTDQPKKAPRRQLGDITQLRSSDEADGNRQQTQPCQPGSRQSKLPRTNSNSNSTSTSTSKQDVQPRPGRSPVNATGRTKPTHQQGSIAAAGRGGSGLSPQMLTKRLQDADSPEQLLQLVQRHTASLNHIHLSAAYTTAVKLCRNGVPPQRQPAAVQQLLSQLRQLATQLQQQCEARQLANIMWACGRLCDVDTFTGLLPVFLKPSRLQQAKPQEVSNVLLAAATLQLQLVDEQLHLLLQHFVQVLPQAKPQAVSNTVWAAATLQQQIPPEMLPLLLQHFLRVLPQAKPQEVSNTLWAVASMQQQMSPQVLQQMLQHFVEELPQASPQNVSNTLLACGKLQYTPLQLLSALEQKPEQLQALLVDSIPQHLANMAWACGQLGYKGRLLPAVLLQQAVNLQAAKSGSLTLHGLSNLCWAAAVLDMQQCVPQVLQLAAATSRLWANAVPEDLQQLYQVHLWLLDSQLPAPGQGLSGVLSQQQLQQCKEAREQQIAVNSQQRVTDLQRSVFAAVLQLPAGTWQQQQQPPQLEQVTPDGTFCMDITATTAAGVKLAIEVDGPSHFIQPGNTLEGATQFRNRALAARGYVVVSIPHWEWETQRHAGQKQQYLLDKLQPALQPVPSKVQPRQQQQPPPPQASQQHQPTGDTAAATSPPAPAARKRRVGRKPLSP